MTTPTITGAQYEALANKKRQLIRKARKGSVYVAPETAAIVTDLTDPATKLLRPLPAGYRDAGWINDDGAQFSSNIDTSDTNSWGTTTPTRSDITNDSSDLQISMQETNLVSVGLYVGVDQAAIKANSYGEVRILKPLQPVKQSYRVITVAVDENAHGEIYVARNWPAAEVSDKDDQSFQSGDDPIMWPVTLSARPDDDLGAAEMWLFGGPGWFALLEEMDIEIDATLDNVHLLAA
jgi:hypothetical protein